MLCTECNTVISLFDFTEHDHICIDNKHFHKDCYIIYAKRNKLFYCDNCHKYSNNSHYCHDCKKK